MYFTFLLLYVYYSVTGTVDGQNCEKLTQLSGEIHDSYRNSVYNKCWFIEVPKNSYVKLDFKEFSLGSVLCNSGYVKIFVNGENETYTFCSQDTERKPIIALNNVKIIFYCYYVRSAGSFRLQFSTENLICAEKNHFRCSTNFCIHKHQVCDEVKDCPDGADEVGCENLICAEKNHFRCSTNFCIHKHQVCNEVKDCPDGADEVGCEKGIMAVEGINISRINAINWLKNQRTESFGWGKNTHRAIIALYLSKAMTFQGDNLEEEIAKQLELQTTVALLRNASDPVSIGELSMFVNALTVTCHNPRHFYGLDLLQILSDRVASTQSPVPSAYLTLCNLNWTFSDSDVRKLMNLLHKHLKYPFHLDIQALTVMALTCVRNKTKNFRNVASAESMYQSTIQNVASQLPDGSFGNVYTTALITQAFISSGLEENKQWNRTATARYLMKQLNSSSVDFLSVYLTLPIFSGRSLVDLKDVDCSNITRRQGNDKEISVIMDKLGEKMQVQYSLYIGDQKDIVHTMYLRMPENSSAYEVMRVAQVADPKYKFLHRRVIGQIYIYKIAGIINDPEASKFWLLYIGDHLVNGNVKHHNGSPDKFILRDNEHLIMWYRTAHI